MLKAGATVGFDQSDPFDDRRTGAVYLGADSAGGGFKNAQMSVTATKFLDRGAGLVATWPCPSMSKGPTPTR